MALKRGGLSAERGGGTRVVLTSLQNLQHKTEKPFGVLPSLSRP